MTESNIVPMAPSGIFLYCRPPSNMDPSFMKSSITQLDNISQDPLYTPLIHYCTKCQHEQWKSAPAIMKKHVLGNVLGSPPPAQLLHNMKWTCPCHGPE